MSRPSRVGAEADPLVRRCAVADEGEHLLAGERQLHGAAPGALGGQQRQHLVRVRRPLGAEAAAHVR